MAEARVSGAEAKVEATKSAMLPSLDFSGNYNYYGMPLTLAPSPDAGSPVGVELHNFYGLNLDLYQPVLTGGNLKNRRISAESKVEMMKKYVEMNKQQVMLNSDYYYWDAVAKKETYWLYNEYARIISKFLKVIQDKVANEVVGKNQLYQTQVRYNDARYQMIRSKKEYMVSIMKLNKMIGLPASNPTVVADSLVVVPWVKAPDTVVQYALSQRPDIGYLQQRIMINQQREKIVGSAYNPQLGIFAGGKWGSPSPGLQKEPGFNYNVGASLSIPIFHWGQKNEEVQMAHQFTQESKLRLEETKDQILLEVQSAYYKLERSQEQLDFAFNSLDNARKNVEVMLDRYNEGLSSVLEVLDAQLYWQKSYFNYIMAKYDLNVAYSQFQYAIGSFRNQ
jgi:outer membrane protein TolC